MGYYKLRTSSGENGNVLFLILIAVALFAALSYAVTQSTRGGGNADEENYKTASARLMNYVSSVKFAADRMQIIGGVSPENIELAVGPGAAVTLPCTSGTNCIFSPDGGGVTAQDFSDLGYISIDLFYDNRNSNTIQDIGTNGTGYDGFLRFGISDAEFCRTINEELGLGSTIQVDTTPIDSNITAYPGESTACYEESAPASGYTFYHVIVAN